METADSYEKFYKQRKLDYKMLEESPINTIHRMTKGKWKAIILWELRDGAKRFGELNRELVPITRATLTSQLRELENDGFIIRKVFDEMPLRVEYSLTKAGEDFIKILEAALDWTEKYHSK